MNNNIVNNAVKSKLVEEDEKYSYKSTKQSQRAEMARLIEGGWMTPGPGTRKKNPFLRRSPLGSDSTEVGLSTPPDSVSDEETVWYTPKEVATPAVKDSEAYTLQRDRSPIPRMKKILHSSPDSTTEDSDRFVTTSDAKDLGTCSDKEVFESTPAPANNMLDGVVKSQEVSSESQDCSVLLEKYESTSSAQRDEMARLVESGLMTQSEYEQHIGGEKLHKYLDTWTGRELRFVHDRLTKQKAANQIKSRLAEKAKQRASSNQCTKQEIFLTTFDTSNGDEDGSIKEARESFWRSCYRDQSKTTTSYKAEDIVRAVNEGSSKFVYTLVDSTRDALKDSFTRWYLGIKWEAIALDDNHLQKLELPSQQCRGIVIFDSISNTGYWCITSTEVSLKVFFKYYAPKVANQLGTSSSSLWFEYKNTALFLSDKRKMEDFESGDLIYVSFKKERSPLKSLSDNNKVNTQRSKIKKKKHKPKSKRSRQVITKSKEELEEEAVKQSLYIWMDNIGRVLSEARPLFKKKREKLNELNLERTKPKQKKVIKPNHVHVVDERVDNLRDVEGKAGKTHFHVLVGEASNLYKTAKPSITSKKVTSTTIDLHGCTKSEALSKLNSSLPYWVDTAMKGDYPFILPVTIICGVGSQILAEVVEKWVKNNEKVANAPQHS